MVKMRPFARDFKLHWMLYLMFLPVLAYYVIFSYVPMYGLVVAFQRYNLAKGAFGSTWVGLKNFMEFFNSFYFWRLTGNTLIISVLDLIFAFPANIIFALLLNEITVRWFKRSVQTITYLPYFVSIVVVAGLITDFSAKEGVLNDVVAFLGGKRQNMLMNPSLFRTIFVASNIWQGIGFGSIIYLAAISGVNSELYEAAVLDGAGKLRQAWHVTIPGIMPTIVILLILRVGGLFYVASDKILLIYNTNTYATGDVIGTFVYRKGLQEANYGYSTAVNMFGNVINMFFLLAANWFSRRFSETSLW